MLTMWFKACNKRTNVNRLHSTDIVGYWYNLYGTVVLIIKGGGAQRSKIKEGNDKMNDRLPGRCGIDRRPEGRENVNQNFGKKDRKLQLKTLGNQSGRGWRGSGRG